MTKHDMTKFWFRAGFYISFPLCYVEMETEEQKPYNVCTPHYFVCTFFVRDVTMASTNFTQNISLFLTSNHSETNKLSLNLPRSRQGKSCKRNTEIKKPLESVKKNPNSLVQICNSEK